MLCVKTETGPDVTFDSEDDTDIVSGFVELYYQISANLITGV
jgi:hypothetical protein